MRNESLILAALVSGGLLAAGCRPAAEPEGALQALLDTAIEHNRLIRDVTLDVDSPALGSRLGGRGGNCRPGCDDHSAPPHPHQRSF